MICLQFLPLYRTDAPVVVGPFRFAQIEPDHIHVHTGAGTELLAVRVRGGWRLAGSPTLYSGVTAAPPPDEAERDAREGRLSPGVDLFDVLMSGPTIREPGNPDEENQ